MKFLATALVAISVPIIEIFGGHPGSLAIFTLLLGASEMALYWRETTPPEAPHVSFMQIAEEMDDDL